MLNVLTHGLGFVTSLWGGWLLVEAAWTWGSLSHLLTSGVFAAGWIFLFAASTLYHHSRHPERKNRLRILDHCAIYAVIAASYGPYMVHVVGGWEGYSLLAAVWAIALGGCAFKLLSPYRYRFYNEITYCIQGWLVVLVFPILLTNLSPWGLTLFLCGGLSFTGGLLFYAWKSLRYHHVYWHLAVFSGFLFIFLSVLFWVLPRA